MFLETARTSLLPLTAEERDLFSAIAVEIYADSEIMKYLGGALSPKEIRERYPSWLEHWETHGFGVCMVKWKATGEMVGMVKLTESTFDGKTELEVGWMILPQFQGKGVGFEVTQRLVQYAKMRFPERAIVAISHPENTPSSRICEKLGFVRDRAFTHKWMGREFPAICWRLGSGPSVTP